MFDPSPIPQLLGASFRWALAPSFCVLGCFKTPSIEQNFPSYFDFEWKAEREKCSLAFCRLPSESLMASHVLKELVHQSFAKSFMEIDYLCIQAFQIDFRSSQESQMKIFVTATTPHVPLALKLSYALNNNFSSRLIFRVPRSVVRDILAHANEMQILFSFHAPCQLPLGSLD